MLQAATLYFVRLRRPGPYVSVNPARLEWIKVKRQATQNNHDDWARERIVPGYRKLGKNPVRIVMNKKEVVESEGPAPQRRLVRGMARPSVFDHPGPYLH
jgi:hypothetical protein